MTPKNTSRSRHYFNLKGKTAEQFVHELAVKSFVTDWCFLNPVLPNGKELCDLLVVFDQAAIIWQVKDLKLGRKGRYKQSEVEKNLRQLSGARRRLFDLKAPIELQNPRRTIETFDPTQITEVFLISVLLGEGEDFFTFVESVGELTTHVFTQEFTHIILTELDTIADFTDYLRAKEALLRDNQVLIIVGGEEELLALYLMNHRSFERVNSTPDVVLDGTFWNKLQMSRRYQLRKKEDKISYGWDAIINRAHEGSKEYEIVARELARPTRVERRVLARTFLRDWSAAHRDRTYPLYRSFLCARNATYCFLFSDRDVPREARQAMLQAMCYVARGNFPQNRKVIGIATEKKFSPTCSYDFGLLHLPSWSSENQKVMDNLQQQFGIFKNPTRHEIQETEYPE